MAKYHNHESQSSGNYTPKISTALQEIKKTLHILWLIFMAYSNFYSCQRKKQDDIDDHGHIIHCLPTSLFPTKKAIVVFTAKFFFSISIIYWQL